MSTGTVFSTTSITHPVETMAERVVDVFDVEIRAAYDPINDSIDTSDLFRRDTGVVFPAVRIVKNDETALPPRTSGEPNGEGSSSDDDQGPTGR